MSAARTHHSTTLFHRIGGAEAVKIVVDDFYERLVNDDKLRKFFDGVDLSVLKKHQYLFMEIAFTEIPDDLDVADLMLNKHKRLFAMGLSETDFDIVVEHLVAAMNGLRVSRNLIDEVLEVLAPLRDVFAQGAKEARHVKDLQDRIAKSEALGGQMCGLNVSGKKRTEKRHGDSLLNRLGGGPAVKAVVDDFYKRLVGDDKLSRFFEGVEISVLKKHQYRFMEIAFAHGYDDVDVPSLMIEKHERLFEMGLNEKHFDMVAAHLVEALEDLSVSEHLISEVVSIVGPLRGAFAKGAQTYEERIEEEEKKAPSSDDYWAS